MADWYVGQPIVCVIGGIIRPNPPSWLIFPVEGSDYTIREIVQMGGQIGFYLMEIQNDVVMILPLNRIMEPPFAVRRFRPKTSTSFQILTSLLAPKEERELVDV